MTRFASRIFRNRRPRPGPPPPVVIYSRAGCHLCDDAIAVARRFLAERGAQPDVIDIDADPHLRERYHEAVPVICVAGQEIARYTLSVRQLTRALEAEPPNLRD